MKQAQGRLNPFSLLLAFLIVFLVSCETPQASDGPAETEEVAAAVETAASPPATWTPLPAIVEDQPDAGETAVAGEEGAATATAEVTETAEPTASITPTVTASSTPSPTPTETPQPTATDTPEPAPTATSEPEPTVALTATSPAEPTSVPAPTAVPEVPPTTPPEPVLGANLLPNASFEEGHYNQSGVSELQLPNSWRLEWDEGPTGVGNAAWDVYVRPEARVLSTAFLPPEEHGLYIYNGQHTVKIFKGGGAVSFRLLTEVTLDPGTYVLEAKTFPDIIERWQDGVKVWANDPYAAEFRLITGDGGTFWMPQNFGQVNVNNFTFTVNQRQTMTVGIAMRGRYAIANNGWFIDDLSLRRIE